MTKGGTFCCLNLIAFLVLALTTYFPFLTLFDFFFILSFLFPNSSYEMYYSLFARIYWWFSAFENLLCGRSFIIRNKGFGELRVESLSTKDHEKERKALRGKLQSWSNEAQLSTLVRYNTLSVILFVSSNFCLFLFFVLFVRNSPSGLRLLCESGST